MNQRNLGILGFVLAATTLIRTGASDVPQAGKPSQQAGLAGQPAAIPICANDPDPDGPWKAAQAYFQLRHPVAGEACKPDAHHRFPCVPLDGNTRFLIATVPDPDATHLALYFDRNMESLLWATTDAGYSFERYWLPWNTEPPKDLVLLQDQECQRKNSETRHRLPGLLVFHETKSPDKSLFLFLVGETPTSGVDKDAWNNALDYVGAMENASPDGKWKVDVVGPSFSGSLAPLGADLSHLPDVGHYRFHFISGMATSGEAIERFRMAIKNFGEYDSVIERDDRAAYLFLRFVDNMWSAPKAVAMLTEAETAYGVTLSGLPKSTLLSFRYPREISRLRNSYQEASPAAPQTGKAPPAAPGVQFTLKDATSDADLLVEKDTVPAFSRLQSPASQQAVLSSVSQTLRRDRVDLGGIVATDILDGLFLSRFLRTVSPDTRVFTLDADLLFLPQSDPSARTGMLSITTYPLFGRDRRRSTATSNNAWNLTQFASRYAQGTYNACGSLLCDGHVCDALQEYGPPRPPLWLTAVGRDGFWPIAKLDEQAEGISRAPPSILRSAPANPQQDESLDPESPAWGWFLLFWLTVFVGILHGGYSIYLWRPHQQDSRMAGIVGKLFKAYPDGRRPLCAQERCFLACISLAAASVVSLIGTPLIRFMALPAFRKWAPWYLLVGGAAVLFLLLAAAILILGRRGTVWDGRKKYTFFVCFGGIATAFLAAVWIGLTSHAGYATGYYFAYRCLSLTSGVAPNVPLLLLALGFVWWGCARLKAESMIEDRRRFLSRNPPAARGAALIHRVDDSIGNLFSFRIWAPAIPFVLVWFQLFVPFRSFRSLEYKSYDNLYTLVVLLFYWAVGVAWMQFLWCWEQFQAYLQWLERQPGRNAFDRLRKEGSWVPLVTAPREHTLFITSRCWDCLRAILAFECPWKETHRQRLLVASLREPEVGMRMFFRDLETDLSAGRGVDRDQYDHLQVLMESAAHSIVQDLQAAEWQQGASDSLADQNKPAGDNRPPAAEPLLVLKEEFVALRALIYMRYVFRHLRVLLGFVIAGFILSVLSMSSYPFQGRRWIGGANAAVCLALGLGVVTVFAQMDRDAVMSRITDTKANELGRTFFLRVAQYGALPLVTLLSSQFPEINRFLFSWLQPAIDAIK